MFDIYSVGDIAYLKVVMLGLSHMYDTNMPYTLGKIGLMISLLFIFAKSIWAPGKIEFKEFFMSLFFIYFLFCHTVTVNLFSSNQSDVTPIPNIPIGLALSASLTTRMGYELATTLRDFYQTAVLPGEYTSSSITAMLDDDPNSKRYSIVGNGLAPLIALVKMNLDGDPSAESPYYKASSPHESPASRPDLQTSLTNYLKDCVTKDAYNGGRVQEANLTQARISNDAWKHLKVSYNGWTTSVNLVHGQGFKIVGCGEAYNLLTSTMKDTFDDPTKDYIESKSLQIDPNKADLQKATKMLTEDNVEVWKIKQNQMLKYMVGQAQIKSTYVSLPDRLAKQAEFNAMYNRKMSSGVQFSLWSEMAIPLMTYLEALIYLLGPIMPFAAAFGSKGIGMLGKYLLLLVWVNTWPVMQVGVNLYLQTYLNQMTNNNSNIGVFSWAGINTTFTDLQSFITMGSTLQTMVPALSLMIMYGSVHTAINLSNAAGSGAKADASNLTPKLATSADSGMSKSGGATNSYNVSTGGTTMTNDSVGTMLGAVTYSASSTGGKALTQSSATSQNKIASAQTALTDSWTAMNTAIAQRASGITQGQAASLDHSAATQAREAMTRSLMKGGDFTAQEAADISSILAGDMGADAQAKLAAELGIKTGGGKKDNGGNGSNQDNDENLDSYGKVAGGLALTGKLGAKAQTALKGAMSAAARYNESHNKGWAQEHSQAVSDTFKKVDQIGESVSQNKTQATGNTTQKLQQLSKTFTDAKQMQDILQAQQNVASSLSSNITADLTSMGSSNSRADDNVINGTMFQHSSNKAALSTIAASGDSESFRRYQEANGGLNTKGDALSKQLSEWMNNSTDKNGNYSDIKDQIKTAGEYAAEFRASGIAGSEQGASLYDSRRAAMLFAQQKISGLQSILGNSYSSNQFGLNAIANVFEKSNADTGGGMQNYDVLASQFRQMAALGDTRATVDGKSEGAIGVSSSDITGQSNMGEVATNITKKDKEIERAFNRASTPSSFNETASKYQGKQVEAQNASKQAFNDSKDPNAVKVDKQVAAAEHNSKRIVDMVKPEQIMGQLNGDIAKDARRALTSAFNSIDNSYSDLKSGSPEDNANIAINKVSGAGGEISGVMIKSQQAANKDISNIVGNAAADGATSKDKSELVGLMQADKAAMKLADRLENSDNGRERQLAQNIHANHDRLQKELSDHSQTNGVKDAQNMADTLGVLPTNNDAVSRIFDGDASAVNTLQEQLNKQGIAAINNAVINSDTASDEMIQTATKRGTGNLDTDSDRVEKALKETSGNNMVGDQKAYNMLMSAASGNPMSVSTASEKQDYINSRTSMGETLDYLKANNENGDNSSAIAKVDSFLQMNDRAMGLTPEGVSSMSATVPINEDADTMLPHSSSKSSQESSNAEFDIQPASTKFTPSENYGTATNGGNSLTISRSDLGSILAVENGSTVNIAGHGFTKVGGVDNGASGQMVNLVSSETNKNYTFGISDLSDRKQYNGLTIESKSGHGKF